MPLGELMLAELVAFFVAAGDPPPTPPAPAPPAHTVTGVVVESGPPSTIAKNPNAAARSAGGEDDGIGDYVAIWPRGAYAAGKSGRVTLSCLIDVHGLAEWCKVTGETPPGQGFGKAALELKPTFKLPPAQG